jgi:hypothetical protein
MAPKKDNFGKLKGKVAAQDNIRSQFARKPKGDSASGIKKSKELLKVNKDLNKELKEQLANEDAVDGILSKILRTEARREAILENSKKLSGDMSEEAAAKARYEAKGLQLSVDMEKSIRDQLSGVTGMVKGAKNFIAVMLANPLVAIAAAILVVVKLLYDAFVAARDLRAELGGSLINSGLIALKLKAVEATLALSGFNSEKVKENFDAIRQNLGGIEAASFGFLVNFSKTAQITGTSGENLAKILSIQESVSDASRETLLAQMEANSLMIEMKGIAPEAVFNDLAENAEFFATSMKAGTNNVMKTAIQARKLGLNLGTVAKISEGLLDFESSIEKQMEASMLLGRQINLDKARQLSFMDDQEGMMNEILKQVGGEAEFEKLKGFQRRALADAVGVSVEELARMAREKEGGAAEAKVKGTVEQTLDVATKSLNVLFDIRDDTEKQVQESKKQTTEMTTGG